MDFRHFLPSPDLAAPAQPAWTRATAQVSSLPGNDTRRSGRRVAAVGVDDAIERVHAWGQIDHVPCSLLTCAFRRSVGGWDGATRDLDEEIPEPGSTRLYFNNYALERARHALAGLEAAPLNGLVTPSPTPPDAAAAAGLREEARKELDASRKLIAECGYNRRDEELGELHAVVAGRRRFADLPPRV